MSVEKIWEDLLLGTDREVIKRGGFGKTRGLGSRPALLVIDPQPNYMGENKPILQQLERYPTGVGEKAWKSLENTIPVLNMFRERHFPVIFTRNVARYLMFDNFATKSNRDRTNYVEGHPDTELVPQVNVQPSDIVVNKGYASAFHGTPLLSYLHRLDIDTLLVCGGTTSGCVRATVVDAASYNYRVGVMYECVFDRIELSHRTSLLDMWMKYADLLSVQEVFEYLKRI